MSSEKHINDLISKFSKLPSIGRKSATKIVFKLLQGEKEQALALLESLKQSITNVNNCPVCNTLTQHKYCSICSNTARIATGKVLVVADPLDINSIEQLGVYDGIYFVLNSLINPLEGIDIEDSGVPKFINFLAEYPIKEVLLALSSSNEGDHTAMMITEICGQFDIKVYRFAQGIPAGASFSNADANTLLHSYLHRTKID